MDTDKKGLAGKIIRSLALSVLGLFFSGCGENCKFQVGSGLPAERQAYGIMQEEYDRKMEQLKGEYQEEMRIQRIITPQNESVNGYLPLGRWQF